MARARSVGRFRAAARVVLLALCAACSSLAGTAPPGFAVGDHVQSVRLAAGEVLPPSDKEALEVVERRGDWVRLRPVLFDVRTKVWVAWPRPESQPDLATDRPQNAAYAAYPAWASPDFAIWVDTLEVKSFIPRNDIPILYGP